MIWILTATASMLPAPEVASTDTLPPLERAWGGTEACDARATLVAAGDRVEWPLDAPDDPHQLLMNNLHVLEAWDSVRGCATVERDLAGVFSMYSAGQVLVAAARSRLDTMPNLAASHALDAYAMGNDASAGPLVAAMVGQALHSEALEVLGALWPVLSDEQRDRTGARLAALHAARPGVDVEAEHAMASEIADLYWLEGACLEAHAEAMDHAERALEAGDPSLLQDRRTPGWAEWLTGCGHGIEEVTADYLETDAELDRASAALVD